MTEYVTIGYYLCILLLLIARIPLAIRFLNNEHRMDKGFFDYNRAEQFLLMVMWYETDKPENNKIVRILNTMLFIGFAGFIGSIVYLYATGAIKEVR